MQPGGPAREHKHKGREGGSNNEDKDGPGRGWTRMTMDEDDDGR